ncbi:hypothetical protein B0H17DRAFT_1129154 [Mycena rosella]|uniref:Uncharacterized protein n=1 Tax=Mycena rosella TaxID=1033263 RepID=A0AAD7GNN3_MYCRO|nr:hypothetical protein B0H17DRAFT_1129154 [Mycena rosella]
MLSPVLTQTFRKKKERKKVRMLHYRVPTLKKGEERSRPNVTVNDNGKKFKCAMIAGNVGKRVCSGDAALLEGRRKDTLYPVAGWWMPSMKRAEGLGKSTICRSEVWAWDCVKTGDNGGIGGTKYLGAMKLKDINRHGLLET